MQRESAPVAEHIESIAVRVSGGCGVILSLVEERAGLLSSERAGMEANAVHGEDGFGFVTLERAILQGRKLLQLANARLGALRDPGWRKPFHQFRNHRLLEFAI